MLGKVHVINWIEMGGGGGGTFLFLVHFFFVAGTICSSSVHLEKWENFGHFVPAS